MFVCITDAFRTETEARSYRNVTPPPPTFAIWINPALVTSVHESYMASGCTQINFGPNQLVLTLMPLDAVLEALGQKEGGVS